MKSLKPLSLPPVLPQGVGQKPAKCKILCPYFSVGEGITEDRLPPNAKVLLMISSPSAEDLLNRSLLTGKAGWSFFKTYIAPLGYSMDDYGVTAVMRCRPRGGKFPLGKDKKGVMEACRHFDQGAIRQFNPDMYVIAHEPKLAYSEPVYGRLIGSDIKRAFDFAAKGFRPRVLLGNEAASLCAPFIDGNGGTKTWHSHYDWFADKMWPHLSPSKEPQAKHGFQPARGY